MIIESGADMSKKLILNQKQINSVVGAAFFPDPVFQACTQVAEHVLNKVNDDKARLDAKVPDSIVGKGS